MTSPFLAALLLAVSPFTPSDKVTQLAPGVYEIEHRDALPDFPQSNTTVVIGDRAVFVVDSAYLPSSTRKDIAQIRQWTNKPVRYLMNTHGHTDHTTGNGIYAREFPGLTIIAHRETRNLMARFVPGYADLFAARTAQMKAMPQPPEKDIAAREARLPDLRTMGENALPDLLIDNDAITIDLGRREVRVAFLGRGNTAGDLVAFLPQERIAIVGDILVHPLPYTCSGFPVDWVKTLDRIEALRPSAIVPGHGEVLHDLDYLHTFRDLLTTVIGQVDSIFQRIPGGGQSSLENAQKAVDVSAFRDKFPAGDQYNPDFFGRSIPNCLVRNVYSQLAPR